MQKTCPHISLVAAGLFLAATLLSAQTRLDRPILVSGGGFTGNGSHIVGGTLTQSAAGLVGGGDQATTSGLGFWFRARVTAAATLRIPAIEAEPGTRVVIPVILENPDRVLRYGPRSFFIRLRYNRSLLEPVGGTCELDGNDCLLEVTGTLSGTLRDTVARLEFIAMLGNAESTPVTFDSVAWQQRGESRFDARTIDGLFSLLGICREGGEIRLIHAGGPTARLALLPNVVTSGTATLDVVAAESLPTRITLIDRIGREQMVILDRPLDAARLYRETISFEGEIPSGSYFIVMQNGPHRRSIPIRIGR